MAANNVKELINGKEKNKFIKNKPVNMEKSMQKNNIALLLYTLLASFPIFQYRPPKNLTKKIKFSIKKSYHISTYLRAIQWQCEK